MFSLHKKRILSSFFILLVLVPVFFMMPAVLHLDSSTTYACGVTDLPDCFVVITKLFFTDIPVALFGFVGKIFDALIAFSLSSTVIKSPEFVDKGWVIMRDLSNTFFIFILLYIAIATILQTAGGQTKKLLATLIMVALFMNFSLYITKFVIDIGNVFALEFYNNLGDEVPQDITIPGITPRSISSGIMSSFNIEAQKTRASEATDMWDKIFIYVMIGILLFILCGVLFSVAMLFLARVVAFWLLMILSPLAFFSMILPSIKGKIWSPWSSQLISQTFFAPIFFFFLYLALILTKTLNETPTSNTLFAGTQNGPGTMLYMFLKFFAIITVLLFGLKTAKGMSGAIGASMTDMGKKSAGLGIGATAGTVAGLSMGLGFGARKLLNMKDADGISYANKMRANKLGNLALKATGDFGAKSTHDFRNIPGVQGIAKMAGIDIGQGRKGGYDASFAERLKEKEAEFNTIPDKLKPKWLENLTTSMVPGDREIARQLYSKMPAKNRAEIAAASTSKSHQDMFQGFAKDMGVKDQNEAHKEALANAKDVRDPNTGAIIKSKNAVRAEYLHGMEDFSMNRKMTSEEAFKQYDKNLNAQREVIESMSADDVSGMLASAKNHADPVLGANQTHAIEDTINKMSPEKQISVRQAILRDVREKIDPTTKKVTTSATQRADIISAISDKETQKILWSKESPDMRAEILAANPELGSLEDTLSDDQREMTRTAKIKVEERKDMVGAKSEINTIFKATPAGTPLSPTDKDSVHAAVKRLSESQIALLSPEILNRKEVRETFNPAILNAIKTRKEIKKEGITAMLKEYIDSLMFEGNIRYLPDTVNYKNAKESLKQLHKMKDLLSYLDKNDQANIGEAIK